ncbi:glycoside hydrolase family 2 TIM barrel-domain containing protein [Mucisphaera calidilacus]|uniref:Beta-galactosidase n=1 Tax=Mucisphaera calidilacus TaxID=2527982 RepID=A0A518BX21_9BACT|nr:glycoside hydrolase family 2 TIM barrel-domain containing protein [Mucisphaera calidilacus]QDU71519.1 Beta-galactosidase [Mucisphaera calidilacus]
MAPKQQNRLFLTSILLSLLAGWCMTLNADNHVTLSGTWRVALDRKDAGLDALSRADPADRGTAWLPGAIQAQGFGDPPTIDSPWLADIRAKEWQRPEYDAYRSPERFKMPFWLQPQRVYVGPVVYERVVEIPQAWLGQRVDFVMERVHWVSEAWLDGRPLGRRESLSTPHAYTLGVVGNEGLAPGEHTLTLRIDNRMAFGVGPNAHSVSDHTQGNWNGAIGSIALHARPVVAIDLVRVLPNTPARRAHVEVHVTNSSVKPADVRLHAEATCPAASSVETGTATRITANSRATHSMVLELGPDAALWSEFTPDRYELILTLESEFGRDTHVTAFGLREIAADDGRFTINGKPVFLRGTLDSQVYPRTGYAPTDEAAWERVFQRIKAFGLNHVRYHSWCPPRAAFHAADRLGLYLQVEGPFWVNQGPQLGLGQPIDQYVYDETDRILNAYGNHPSFVLMASGNEPDGPEQGGRFLRAWIERYKQKDPRRLYTSGAGWPLIDENQFHVAYQPRIQRWGEGLDSSINSRPPSTDSDYTDYVQSHKVPVIAHEIGQWCAFPDFDEMSKYTGPLKPKNFEVFRDLLARNGQAHMARRFLMSSGRLQLLCYKEEIEAALRTPGYGGFQLLDLHDFPGQGTALVGVLDPFWDPKPYVTASEYRSFCGPVTPLARLPRRVYTGGEALEASLQVAQFGATDLIGVDATWSLETSEGIVLASGAFGPLDLPAGALHDLGDIRVTLPSEQPTRATLRVDLADSANQWDVWIYPDHDAQPFPDDLIVTHHLDDAVIQELEAGGTVLLLLDATRLKGDVAFGFSPVFWNTAWTDNQPPHTLGIHLDPEHPAFRFFPTRHHTDWQWWDLIGYPDARAGAMLIDHLPPDLEPVVRPIDTWFRSRRLAALFEARVGEGRLMVCSFDLTTDLDQRPAARQLRRSLITYMRSKAFSPSVDVDPAAINKLLRDTDAQPKP